MEKEVGCVSFGYCSHETIEGCNRVKLDTVWHQVEFSCHFFLDTFKFFLSLEISELEEGV